MGANETLKLFPPQHLSSHSSTAGAPWVESHITPEFLYVQAAHLSTPTSCGERRDATSLVTQHTYGYGSTDVLLCFGAYVCVAHDSQECKKMILRSQSAVHRRMSIVFVKLAGFAITFIDLLTPVRIPYTRTMSQHEHQFYASPTLQHRRLARNAVTTRLSSNSRRQVMVAT